MSIVNDVRAQEVSLSVTREIFFTDAHYSHGLSN